MADRLGLHEELVSVLGTRYVYFQPPESVKMNYPCIVYEKQGVNSYYADDAHYIDRTRYNITVIDKDPDSEIAERVFRHFKQCSYDRRYIADNLNHDVLTILY